MFTLFRTLKKNGQFKKLNEIYLELKLVQLVLLNYIVL